MGNEIKKLSIATVALVFFAVGAILGTVILTGFSETVRTNTPYGNTSLYLQTNVSTRIGTSGQYPYPQTAACINSTNTLAAEAYDLNNGDSNGGFIILDDYQTNQWNGSTVNCTGTYLADSTAQGTADIFILALVVFGTFASIIALSIIGKTVIDMFQKKD